MKKLRALYFCAFLFILGMPFSLSAQSQEQDVLQVAQADTAAPVGGMSELSGPTLAVLTLSGNVTLDFKDADIQNVLKLISYKAGVNIVSTPDVMGNVSIRLADVPWQMALDVLLKTYGFAYQRQGNILLVTKLETIARIQAEEPLQTEIFILKFLDAQDAQKILVPLLSPRGKISVLYARGQKGWKFGSFKIGRESVTGAGLTKDAEIDAVTSEPISIEKDKNGDIVSKKADFVPSVKSKTLVITDTTASLDRVRNVILPQIDKRPHQVMIETRIMEVDRDKLRDIGLDYGTGPNGASNYRLPPGGLNLRGNQIGGRNLSSEFAPSVFGPLEGTTALTGAYPYSAGLEIIYKQLTGEEFEVILHALEEDAHTNALAEPKILTLDNQEASILVGYHTPILKVDTSAGSTTTGTTQSTTLDYYQEIGIRLNVVPQVNEDGYINMIIHPSVTSSNANVIAKSVVTGATENTTTTIDYPIIDVREAQTQIMIKSGETVVLGGLLKEVKREEVIGIPYLSKIPLLGNLFKRTTTDNTKIDLLIFITATIADQEVFTPAQINNLQKQLGKDEDHKTVSVTKTEARKP